tara:strand:- start:128 stop:286 length:159 start_codon:yes stop_codon:yes gene_type:complete
MDTVEIMVWLVFIIIISLLFFAAFGNSKYNESSIEEYMQKLIDDEALGNGPS